MNKKSFKEVLKKVARPKDLKDDTILPYEFDLYWDAKTGKDLKSRYIVPESEYKQLRESLVKHGFDANKFFEKMESTAKLILHHDDPPCYERLESRDGGNYCPVCQLHPDMQSTCFHSYCRKCNVELVKMKCPICKKVYKESSL